jgi:hypothetical protein
MPRYEIENSTANPYAAGKWTILCVAPGTYNIRTSISGYIAVSTSVTVGSGETQVIRDMRFELQKTVYGRVSLPEAAQDTVYVSVEAAAQGASGGTGWGWTMIEPGRSSGTYTISGLEGGLYTVRAWAPGYAKGEATLNVAQTIENAPQINLAGGGVLSGTITVDGDTTDPALNLGGDPYMLNLNAWSPDAYSYGWTQVSSTKSVNVAVSTFTIRGLADGTYWVNSWLNGFELQGATGWNGVKATVANGSGTVNLTFRKYRGRSA